MKSWLNRVKWCVDSNFEGGGGLADFFIFFVEFFEFFSM